MLSSCFVLLLFFASSNAFISLFRCEWGHLFSNGVSEMKLDLATCMIRNRITATIPLWQFVCLSFICFVFVCDHGSVYLFLRGVHCRRCNLLYCGWYRIQISTPRVFDLVVRIKRNRDVVNQLSCPRLSKTAHRWIHSSNYASSSCGPYMR